MGNFDWLQNLMQEDGEEDSDNEKTASTQEDVNIDELADNLEKLAENLETTPNKSSDNSKSQDKEEDIEDEDEEVDKKAEEEVKQVLIDKALTEPEVKEKLLQAKKARGKGGE